MKIWCKPPKGENPNNKNLIKIEENIHRKKIIGGKIK